MFVEDVRLQGHILDSLLLPKVLDTILSRGGNYHIKDLKLGNRSSDASTALLEVRAETAAKLEEILDIIHDHGAIPVNDTDCLLVPVDIAGTFPDGFYCTTNFPTEVRLDEGWVPVKAMEMDCGIFVNSYNQARCVPMTETNPGDKIVVGLGGVRVFPPQSQRRTDLFEFMSSPVSSEKPKGVTVREIASAMRRCKLAGEKILAVLGPAVVHTGGSPWVSWLIRQGYIQVLFAGNALATHDMEQAFYGTSLGVSLEEGLPAAEGHEHHLRTINTIRRIGGIPQAVASGLLKTGIMYECVKAGVTYVLAGSIRDDGPLPDVITDMIQAQQAMRKEIPGVGFCLMAGTTLHSIATGNMLPGGVKVACVDINPATVTKLMDRGSTQTIGIVSDVEPFLRSLVMELEKV
jgi:lysine-ketoglutarate reductase/saccharopine dehydrogenase-like protein (TIGR00300 family)